MDTASGPGIPDEDRRVLRELGRRMSEIAALAVQQERRELWTRLNDLQSVRPMVWIFEVPWNEMDAEADLRLRCSHPLARGIEDGFRKRLYQWRRMPGDMVVGPVFEVPPVLRDTGFGLWEDVDIERTDESSSVVSRRYHIQISTDADFEKIRMPEISLDVDAWRQRLEVLSELFDGVMPVRKTGIKGTSIAPWDYVCRLTGIEEVLMDMAVRPDYVHRLMEHLTRAYLVRLERWEELNVLAFNNDTYTGGGYQYTTELPPPGADPARVRPGDMWGRTMSQIFSAVSPAMHEEFALRYECRWLNRFGLTYYGCCEPLDRKVDILRRNVPNLRKISMSPWIDLEVAARNVGTDYVFSWKVNPAIFTDENWSSERARRELRDGLERLRGLHVEIIMKDISTVDYHPERLWEWSRIAVEEAERVAG
ncbi:MAG: hypothetical protein GXP31_07195 [Kiritimatiellaeota bacterium]|nr:hypothetical protein [Kiritimatiellota bacterium]